MQKITPFLWFNDRAEEAINFYTSIFKNSEIKSLSRGPDGKLFVGTFVLDGLEIMALNGGPMYTFSPANSMLVHCADQEEVDYYWDRLSPESKSSNCGWIDDKFGVTWQIVPNKLMELMASPDPAKSKAVMDALMPMTKIIIADLQKAYDEA